MNAIVFHVEPRSGSLSQDCYLKLISPLSIYDHYHEGKFGIVLFVWHIVSSPLKYQFLIRDNLV